MTLFHQTVADNQDTPNSRVPTDAKGWCEEARIFEESGDWTRAVVCYRRALQLSPFSGDLRDLFEDAIEQQILAAERGPAKVRRVAPGKAPAPVARVRQVSPPVRKAAANNLFKTDDDQLDQPEAVDAEEWDDDVEEKPRGIATGPARSAAPRRAVRREGGRYSKGVWVAGVFAAIILTSAGLFAAVGTTNFLRGIFSSGVPTLDESKMPAEVKEVISNASALMDKSEFEDAATLLTQAKQQFPKNTIELNGALARVHRTSAQQSNRDKKYEAAAKSYMLAAEADPEDSVNWIDRGRALREQARELSGSKNTTRRREVLAAAQKSFEKAIDLSPKTLGAWIGAAQVQEARNNRTQAIDAYQKVVAIAPDSNEARLARTAIDQLQKK